MNSNEDCSQRQGKRRRTNDSCSQNSKRNRNKESRDIRSLAVKSAMLMIEQHTILLDQHCKEIERIVTDPINNKNKSSFQLVTNDQHELKETYSHLVSKDQYTLNDDDPLHEIIKLSKQLKNIKSEIRVKRKALESVQICTDDEKAIFNIL